jgi:hypothetical protein
VKANLIPFAVVCAGWIVPLLRFWVSVWWNELAPPVALFVAFVAVSASAWWLPPAFYRIRRFEATGRLYESAGVRLFRMITPDGDFANAWRRRREHDFRVIANAQSARDFVARTIIGEKSHVVGLLVGVFSSAWAWHIEWNGWLAYLTVANIVVNVYPILLQRYTRARIVRILGISAS